MGSPLPPDPYLALGVAKDAAAAAIKSQYRKLVLKFHPDKVQDETQKQAASDEFHKIQTAYEIVGDEERRARYDAQCKLAQLRREVMSRHGGRGADSPDMKSSTFKSSMTPEMPRAASFQARDSNPPTYEERKPAYASTDYFDIPRTSSRKAHDAERTSKKSAPREDRERDRKSSRISPKDNKKSERADREERSRRATKDIRREREHKASIIVDPDLSSESDAYEHNVRRSRAEEDVRRSREATREMLRDQPRRSKEETSHAQYDSDEKPRKFHNQFEDARDYITRSRRRPEHERQETERRPSPIRYTSSKDHIAYTVGSDGRPIVRRDSARPQVSEMRRSSVRDYEQKAGGEEYRRPFTTELVDDARDAMPRRPPTLNQSRSSPADMKIPADKPRSQSMQIERDTNDISHAHVRRSETMPHVSRNREAYRPKERATPQRSSTLRQIETTDDDDGAGPEPFSASSARRRYDYDNSDDAEGRQSRGYRTEVREPTASARRYTQSPSPMGRHREADRDRARPERRTTTTRFPSASPPKRPNASGRTTSKTYTYPRPQYTRENSSRNDRLLFGEVGNNVPPASISPAAAAATMKTNSVKYSPPVDGVRYQREVRPDDIRPQTGYGYIRRPSEARVSISSRG